MRLDELGEFGLIARLQDFFRQDDKRIVIGPGDDCAVLQIGESFLAVTTDMMLEGRHFRRDWLTAREIGARAFVAALSDIAAMGAVPAFALASLAIPGNWTAEEATELLQGLAQEAESYGVSLVGGDTNAAPAAGAILDIMLLGLCRAHIWRRSGAQIGDAVYVTGSLGGAAAAVAAKNAGLRDVPGWDCYARPTPRVEAAARLNPLGRVHCAIDISDGLVQDARHICECSHVGIVLHAAHIPLHPAVPQIAAQLGTEPLLFALTGGEDYELLLTASPEDCEALNAVLDIPLTKIGAVVPGDNVTVLDAQGLELTLPAAGWDHFRNI